MANESTQRKPFNMKGMTTFIVFFSFLALSISGAILYASPKGRIANWTDWSVLGLNKEGWSALHMATALLFLVAGIVHLYFNWTVFWSYFKARFQKGFNLKREFAIAFAISALVLLGTLWALPPFSYVVSLNDNIKEYWETASAEPPVPHAEEWTMPELAQNTGLSLDVIVARFESKGYAVPETSETLQSIALRNGVSPKALFALVSQTTNKTGMTPSPGSGMGRKTLAEFCSEQNIAVETALDRLQAAGIDADSQQSMKSIAEAEGLTPAGIANIVVP